MVDSLVTSDQQVLVVALMEAAAKVEIEATAVIPDPPDDQVSAPPRSR